MENDIFENNIAIIIPQDGKEIIVPKKKEEKFHYETFDRINKNIVPGIIDDLIIDKKAFSGYNLIVIAAAKNYAVFINAHNLKVSNELYLSVPSKVTQEQYESINNMIQKLKDKIIYVFVCEKNEVDVVFTKPIASYVMNTEYEVKYLDDIKEISIIEKENKIIK